MEHRWGQRIAADMPVSLVGTPAAIGIGRILNASTTGALVQTSLPLPLLSLVCLQTTATLPYLGPIGPLMACVVRHGANEIGIEWCDADSDAVLQLLAALREDLPVRSAHLACSTASSAREIPRESSRNNLISASSNTSESRLPSSRYALAAPDSSNGRTTIAR
jgi:hypothetical protein